MSSKLPFRSLALGASIAISAVPDYGFPRCYVSFPSYDTNFVDDTASHEVRPLTGQQRYPYSGSTSRHCKEATEVPLIGLGPHWSPIGLTVYKTSRDGVHNLPDEFSGRLIVVSHGSWNRNPWIGYNVNAYEVDFKTDPYEVAAQKTLLPALRGNSGRIRPVDVRTSPVNDGALLMTADRDDYDAVSTYGGGLYRIVGSSDMSGESNENGVTRISIASLFDAASSTGVALDRLASIPCARQLTHSTSHPQLVYISTLSLFCPAKFGTGDSIFAVELSPTRTVVKRGPVKVVSNLRGPQGIDYHNGSLYVATNGDSQANSGNCLLEVSNIDHLAMEILSGSQTTLDGKSDVTFVSELSCGFTRLQGQHHWRSVRVHPSGQFAIISVGADCNWATSCTNDADISKKELQTTLLKIKLTDADKGAVSIAATGIRNAIGLFFDENSNLLFTSFGSDRASGIPGASSHNNVPDCAVEVLKFDGQASDTPIEVRPGSTAESTTTGLAFTSSASLSMTTSRDESTTSGSAPQAASRAVLQDTNTWRQF
eukprot:TRINITY_DN62841_c0_g1_i1.p1 TRINITY_DN62841_c0_g1~~TRINITY_DN62841_c0_g1_i1.p1  ORF type:complete len:541 (+),score=57.89 TRINITY_DN62841_c0_g1_i1:97-1719(+)